MRTRTGADRPKGVRWLGLVLIGLGLAVGAPAAHAQPFGAWMTLVGNPTNGWVNVPHNSAFNLTGAFTFEAWVAITNSTTAEDCRSIAGKRYLQTWWIGQCTVSGQPTLRSYLKGVGSLKQGGIIPRGVWTHVAVVFNGTQRLHYINGELAATFSETGPLPTNGEPIQIGSDLDWVRSPTGAIDEVRLWNVARTTDQIRASINKRITTAQPGLVSVWPLDGTPADIIHGHDGTAMGAGLGVGNFAALFSCAGLASPTALCLQNRFLVSAKWRTNPTPGTPTDGGATVAVNSANSGVLWFFSSDNWEVLVKAINACIAPYNRYWIYSAAITDVFYRLEVLDVRAGQQKIYFNYPGSPAPAVTDSDAFATCP
jgi:concanavalin A-like lectin/glucanase superfamily protein